MKLDAVEAYYNLGVSYAEMHKYDKAAPLHGLLKCACAAFTIYLFLLFCGRL